MPKGLSRGFSLAYVPRRRGMHMLKNTAGSGGSTYWVSREFLDRRIYMEEIAVFKQDGLADSNLVCRLDYLFIILLNPAD